MAAVKSSRTDLEEQLASEMWRIGLRGWRRHRRVAGTRPDFFFGGAKVAVFVDGCFWHACPTCSKSPATNRDYWQTKLQGNSDRDLRQTAVLQETGHTVVRLWGHEIKTDAPACARRVAFTLHARRKPT